MTYTPHKPEPATKWLDSKGEPHDTPEEAERASFERAFNTTFYDLTRQAGLGDRHRERMYPIEFHTCLAIMRKHAPDLLAEAIRRIDSEREKG